MHNRWNIRRISLWTFLLMQIILVLIYFSQTDDTLNANPHNLQSNSISFVQAAINISTPKSKYYNEKNTIILTSKHVEDLYKDFNTSLCYRPGTDLASMKRHKDINWKCICLGDWHGADCGQPEVIWRAFLASKKPLSVSGPRKLQRRLIYFSEIRATTVDFLEVTLYELQEVADLFILHDVDPATSDIQSRLRGGYLKDLHSKILYINGANTSVWKKVKRAVRNLRQDDIFFISRPFEIPNVRALMFLKLYDGWPQPLTFRLRWSVYGFFWRHPQRTVLSTGACTVGYLYEALEDRDGPLKFISNAKTQHKQGFIVGDLNHFGGWFCEFCAEPNIILKIFEWDKILVKLDSRKIDVAYIEDLIENGLYVDGKMELQRAHRYNEHYYAPVFVTNNSWKFDWLLANLYSKLDYY